jgi:hypothetical protein
MARNVLPDQYYTFNPSTRTITLSRAVKREQLLLITNVTTNTVIYNFSDPNLKATSYTNTSGGVAASGSASDAITTVVLNYNTSSMNAADKLQIIVDEYESKFVPGETLTDPVGKFRTSVGQALIDTDFEYGLQPTKWEMLSLVNNKQSMYVNLDRPNFGRDQAAATTITSITATNGSRFIQVTVGSATGFAIGQGIFIQDSYWAPANGFFIIEALSSNTFTYRARETWVTGSTPTTALYDADLPTQIFDAPQFTGVGFGGTVSAAVSGQAVTVTTTNPHGLYVGNDIMMVNNQNSGTTVAGVANSTYGNHQVATVLNPFQFVYYTDATGGTAGTFGTDALVAKNHGSSMHRPFDGGVNFSTNTGWHGQQMIRQTRRYFRYQSGKGIQCSTGTALKTQLYIDQLKSSGSTVTVLTKFQHGLQPGISVNVGGSTDTAYNGTFTVANVLDSYRFTYIAGSTPANTVAPGNVFATISSWYGGVNRTGMFDNQNGLFFEFDGQQMYVVRRNSTYQLGGFASINANSHQVNGFALTSAVDSSATPQYSKQLAPNDYVVIRGMSYRVLHVIDDSTFHITPQYRGTSNASKVVVSKTQEFRVPQSQWNLDRCDGTGPSGFILDPNKMQMYYIDYSWYGAGWVRFGFRAADGNIVYVHKIVNNNQNTEAYMRSGNLPARYETNTFAPSTTIVSTLNSGDTSISVADTSKFPTSGILMVRSMTSTSAGQTEFINYTSKSSNTFTGLTRGQAGASLTFTATSGSTVLSGASTAGVQIGQFVYTATPGEIPQGAYVVSFVANTSVTLSRAVTSSGSKTVIFAPMGQTAQTFAYSATRPVSVELHAPFVASTIQHWGTSVIMDGRFDDDKSFVFTRGSTTAFPLAASLGVTNALMSIRVAPTVSNGNAASVLGSRDLINRMQMVLRQLDIYTNGAVLVTLVLNGKPSTNNTWLGQGGSSLAQYYIYGSAATVVGGEVIGGFYVNPPGTIGSTAYTATSIDLAMVRDMGNSITGGGAAGTQTQYYPDGPDVLTIMVTNLTATASNVYGRLSWTEAQA